MFDSRKKLKLCNGEQVMKKLSTYQRTKIEFNSCLLSFYTNQHEQFKNKSKQLQQSQSPLAPLLIATHHIREKKLDQAIQVLRDSNCQNTVVQLSLAELLKSNGTLLGAKSLFSIQSL